MSSSAAEPPAAGERVLVIRLGALGDFALSMGPFAAIRAHHPKAHVSLLTTDPYADFAKACPYFDEVQTDPRPQFWQIGKWRALRRWLRERRFDRIYDLQTSDRSSFYYRLMGPGRRPDWSGIAAGCSLPDSNPERDLTHTIERQREQLRLAGIDDVPLPDLGWVEADLRRLQIGKPYALLVPGGAPHRPAKRWPLLRYIALAGRLAERGVAPVVIGGPPEAAMGRSIAAACETAVDLTGRTSFTEIVALARGAAVAVGNDTGPIHLIALSGCPTVVLFSGESDPALTAPRAPAGGGAVTILRQSDLEALPVETVWRDAAKSLPS